MEGNYYMGVALSCLFRTACWLQLAPLVVVISGYSGRQQQNIDKWNPVCPLGALTMELGNARRAALVPGSAPEWKINRPGGRGQGDSSIHGEAVFNMDNETVLYEVQFWLPIVKATIWYSTSDMRLWETDVIRKCSRRLSPCVRHQRGRKVFFSAPNANVVRFLLDVDHHVNHHHAPHDQVDAQEEGGNESAASQKNETTPLTPREIVQEKLRIKVCVVGGSTDLTGEQKQAINMLRIGVSLLGFLVMIGSLVPAAMLFWHRRKLRSAELPVKLLTLQPPNVRVSNTSLCSIQPKTPRVSLADKVYETAGTKDRRVRFKRTSIMPAHDE